MSSQENLGQEDRKSARPPEYTVIRRQAPTRSGQLQPPQASQSKKARPSKKELKFDEAETKREQRREQRYQTRRRRQWILAIGITVIFIILLVIALRILASRAASTAPAGGTPAGGTTPGGSVPFHNSSVLAEAAQGVL